MNARTEQPKIVIFSSIHSATDDRIFHKQARSLARAGYDVTVFASAPHDDLLDGVRIRAVKPFSSRVTRVISSLRLFRLILRQKADVYHFHDLDLLPVGLMLRLLGRKVVYDAHEDYPKDILGKSYLPRWLRPILSALINPLEKWAARRMNAVVTATESIGDRFPGRIVLHNFPILSYLHQASGPACLQNVPIPYVIYCGSISRILGALEMVRAVSAASCRSPVKLRLFGRFEDRPLQAQMTQSSTTVDYRGFIPMRQVYHHYAGAVAGLALYHPFPNHIEAMPNKLFEFMACGVPLIASDFPLWREMVYDQGCGLVVDPLDIKQIADAIIYLLEHLQEAKRMGERGRKLAKTKYNWETEAKKLLLLYDRLLAG